MSRLVIPDTLVVAGSSVSIPLKQDSISTGGYKIGIQVALADPNNQENEPVTCFYELDTGGEGFFAGKPEAWTNVTGPQISTSYTSGNSFVGVVYPVEISFPGVTAPLFNGPIDIAMVTDFTKTDPKTGKTTQQSFPYFNYLYGDFGLSLQPTNPQNGPSILNVLAQMQGNYGTGFIVDVGPYPGQGSGTPQLIVGLTSALRALFPIQIPMLPGGVFTPPLPVYSEVLSMGNLTLTRAGTPYPATNLGVVFDTGAPGATIHVGSQTPVDPFTPQKDDQVLLANAFNTAVNILNYTVGTVIGQNDLNYIDTPSKDSRGYVNTGLAPFFANPVMFDLENGVIGLVASA